MDNNENEPLNDSQLHNLVANPSRKPAGYNPFYSKFVRWMRLVLPLAALAITAVVFTWQGEYGQPVKPPGKNDIPPSVRKNELLNPRFENTDEKNQTYTLTAKRAIQDEMNEKLVLLERPVADMRFENERWVSLEAAEGRFDQAQRTLALSGTVRLFHDGGYQLETSELFINVPEHQAISRKDVRGQGPEGTLEAKGLTANSETGSIIFNGPAKLILNSEAVGMGSKGLMQ